MLPDSTNGSVGLRIPPKQSCRGLTDLGYRYPFADLPIHEFSRTHNLRRGMGYQPYQKSGQIS